MIVTFQNNIIKFKYIVYIIITLINTIVEEYFYVSIYANTTLTTLNTIKTFPFCSFVYKYYCR